MLVMLVYHSTLTLVHLQLPLMLLGLIDGAKAGERMRAMEVQSCDIRSKPST